MKKLFILASAILMMGLVSCEEETDPTKSYCWSFNSNKTSQVYAYFWGTETDALFALNAYMKHEGIPYGDACIKRTSKSHSDCGKK